MLARERMCQCVSSMRTMKGRDGGHLMSQTQPPYEPTDLSAQANPNEVIEPVEEGAPQRQANRLDHIADSSQVSSSLPLSHAVELPSLPEWDVMYVDGDASI